MKILVCEDDVMTLKAIEHRLRKDNYEVVTAIDGLQASEILQTDKGIDLLLTDLHMPNVNGLELITLLRDKLKMSIPIIMLTRVGIEDTVLQAFELGADDYITKPFNPDELSLRIKRILLKNKK
jgi:two-component system, OmpR family, response regulator VicR